MTSKFYLKDYLGPGGKYPYETLAPKMEQALQTGDVHLISVPGFLMVIGHHEDKGRKYPWVSCNAGRDMYTSAADAISYKNGVDEDLAFQEMEKLGQFN